MNRKYSIWTICIIIFLLAISSAWYYVWNNYSGRWTGECAHLPQSERNSCCLKIKPDVMVIACDGGWTFDESIKKCSYECTLGGSTKQTPPSPSLCTEDVKKCPDGSFVSRDGNNNCEFKPCP